ncbi:MAG: LysM peptidoglycan-binding domain-containing protein [Anaerolineales bacterium]|nr:LysM peptidoglycan-binding domain-containing protein [Anaerolineales bacterium]
MILRRLLHLLLSLALVGCGTIEIGLEPTSAPVGMIATTGAAPAMMRSATTTLEPITATAAAGPEPTEDHTSTASATAPSVRCAARHLVRAGETLMDIGQAYGADWNEIAVANGLSSPSLIFTGQDLCIPTAIRTPAPPTRVPTTRTPTPTEPTATPTATATATASATPCSSAWFFTPAPVGCPEAAATTSSGALQRFERGQMLWISVTDRYYLLFNAGALPTDSRMSFIELGTLVLKPNASPDNRVLETPPPGLVQPISGFGLIWRDEVVADLAQLGGLTMRQAIGWGLESEYSLATAIQCGFIETYSGRVCFVQASGQRVIALGQESGIAQTWWWEVGP